MKQVAEHSTPDDCWVVIGEKVYKIPEAWTKIHPGGHLPLKAMAGKDATDAFVQYHPNSVYKMISRFYIANVVQKDTKESVFVKEHRAIRQRLLEEGMFKTDYTFYYWILLRCLIIAGSALYFTLACEGVWTHLFGAALLGCLWQ